MIKLQKLVTRATSHEFDMHRLGGVANGGGWPMMGLHAEGCWSQMVDLHVFLIPSFENFCGLIFSSIRRTKYLLLSIIGSTGCSSHIHFQKSYCFFGLTQDPLICQTLPTPLVSRLCSSTTYCKT